MTAFSDFHQRYKISAADFKINSGIKNIKILWLFKDSEELENKLLTMSSSAQLTKKTMHRYQGWDQTQLQERQKVIWYFPSLMKYKEDRSQ